MKKRIVSMLLAALTVLSLCTSALAAPVKTARHWRVYMDLGSLHLVGSKAAKADAKAPCWQPAWLPEGWALEYAASLDGVWAQTNWAYVHGEEVLELSCYTPSDFSFSHWMDFEASNKTPKKATKIQGYQADYWKVKQESALAWEDKAGNLFMLYHTGSLTQKDLEKVAGSVVELAEPMPDYRLGWVAGEGGRMTRTAAMPGYTHDVGGGHAFVRFDCAAQPLAAPEREPQAVTVQGVEAKLWLGDPKAKGTVVSGTVSGEVVEIPTEETWSTLLWTDPETGIHFRLKGSKLSKADMLRMAESVVQAEAPAV